MNIITSLFTNPFVNLSLGAYFARKVVERQLASRILFLSSSHEGVYIGRHQNCWKECDVAQLRKDRIALVRRDTGGGACFVDGGNRLFSCVLKRGQVERHPQFISAGIEKTKPDLGATTLTVKNTLF